MHRRFKDWDARLAAYVDASRARRFRYGARGFDCGVFGFGAVAAITGKDYMPEFGAYRGAKQAQAAVDREGGMIALLDKRFEKIAPGFAQRGDLGLIDAPGQVGAFGICVVLGDTLAAPGASGLELVPRARLLHAFRV